MGPVTVKSVTVVLSSIVINELRVPATVAVTVLATDADSMETVRNIMINKFIFFIRFLI